jgi:hypothetical protein
MLTDQSNHDYNQTFSFHDTSKTNWLICDITKTNNMYIIKDTIQEGSAVAISDGSFGITKRQD